MRYTKVKRILSGLLTMAMLAGQAPQVMAAGTEGFAGDEAVIEFEEDEEEAEAEAAGDATESISEDTASENTASEDAVSDETAAEEDDDIPVTLEDIENDGKEE